jgi:hypothetical protein
MSQKSRQRRIQRDSRGKRSRTGARHVARPVPTALAAAVACALAPSTAEAVSTGYAANNASGFTTSLCPTNPSGVTTCAASFNQLKSGLGFTWARFFIDWDAAGTTNASGTCISSPLADLSQVMSAMTTASNLGMTPLLAISAGGDPPDVTQYTCGAYELMLALKSYAHPLYIEAFNEPENSGESAYDAAEFWYYLKSDDTAIRPGDGDDIIAGTFGGASSSAVAAGTLSVCSGGGYDWEYVCELTDFGDHPTSWSFHDYDDPQMSVNDYDGDHGSGCTAVGASGCSESDVQNFRSLLSSFGQSTSDIWLTESGVYMNGGISGSQADPPGGPYQVSAFNKLDGTGTSPNGLPYAMNQAEAAEDWKTIADSGLVSHMFYYEFQTYGNGYGSGSGSDTFDSALIGNDAANTPQNGDLVATPYWTGEGNVAGNGVPRTSYCVLAFDETPAQALADTRCDYAQGGPNPNTGVTDSYMIPWTSWQGGNPGGNNGGGTFN